MKRKMMLLCMAVVMSLVLFGCGKEKEQDIAENLPAEQPDQKEPEVIPEPEIKNPEGMARSYLTGELIDEEIAAKRPYAVMIGNTVDALPQFGIGSADVIYEVPVEGSYTRLMAIFQDLTGVDKIGSARSCRHYFIYFAREFDAIYAHFGQAVYAEPILAREDVHNINGMDRTGSNAYYRDSNRKSPHNAFTSAQNLLDATEKNGYRTEYKDTYQGHFRFAEDGAPVELADGSDALVISPGYFVNKPWFVYNPTDGLYYRNEFKKKQVDGANDEQLKVKNVLIQYCGWKYADENGYLDINTLPEGKSGDGKYFTNGKVIDVTWTKADEDSPARYFDASGNEITINQGKTWVCVVRNKYKERLHIYQTEEELMEARMAE